jgi:hypothetical protein
VLNLTYNFFLFCLLFILSIPSIAQENYRLKEEDKRIGLVNSKNKWVIPPEFIEIQEPLPTLYAVRNTSGLWGFITPEKKITECLYNNFRFVSNERILVQKNRRWGLIGADGKKLIPYKYRYINPSKNNTYKAMPYNQWTVRTFDNKLIFTLEFDSIEYLGDNIYKFCLAGTYGLTDQNGAIITTENQDFFEATLERKKPKKEFANAMPIIPKGDFKIPLEENYDTVYHFSEGLAKFKTFGKYGFVDSLGNIRLVPQYTNAQHFSEGMVAVMLTGKWGFMNTNEVLCVQPYFDEVSDFKNGKALVRKENKYNFVDKKGNYLYGDFFDLIQPTYSGKYTLRRNNQYGMADEFGREFISTKYEYVAEMGNSFILAKEHHLWGVLNNKGDIVIPFNYSVAQYDPEHNRMITMEPGIEITISVE